MSTLDRRPTCARILSRLRAACLGCSLSLGLSLGGCALSPHGSLPPSPYQQLQNQLDRDPKNPRILLALAEAYMREGDSLRAQQYQRVAERIVLNGPQPDGLSWPAQLVDYTQRLGLRIAVRDQQYSEAIRRCRMLLEESESVEMRQLLAVLLEALGEETAAERERQLLLSLYPGEPRFLFELGRMCRRSQDPARHARGKDYFERYLVAAPDGPQASSARAILAAYQHDIHEGPRE